MIAPMLRCPYCAFDADAGDLPRHVEATHPEFVVKSFPKMDPWRPANRAGRRAAARDQRRR